LACLCWWGRLCWRARPRWWAGPRRRGRQCWPKRPAWPRCSRRPSGLERLWTGRSTLGGFSRRGQGQRSGTRPDRGDRPANLRGANPVAPARALGRPSVAASRRADTSGPICGGAHARDETPHAQENNYAIWSGHASLSIETGKRAPAAACNDYRAPRPRESTPISDVFVPNSAAMHRESLSGWMQPDRPTGGGNDSCVENQTMGPARGAGSQAQQFSSGHST